MTRCSIEREWEGGRAVFRLSGTFDRAAACELDEALAAESADEIVLEFAHVDDFYDLGIALLAQALAKQPGRCILLSGLRQHQLRMFLYFGIDVDELARTASAGRRTRSPHPRP